MLKVTLFLKNKDVGHGSSRRGRRPPTHASEDTLGMKVHTSGRFGNKSIAFSAGCEEKDIPRGTCYMKVKKRFDANSACCNII